MVRTHEPWRGGERRRGEGRMGGRRGRGEEERREKKKGKWEEREGSLITQSATHRIQSLESNKQVTHKQHTRQSRDERWSE